MIGCVYERVVALSSWSILEQVFDFRVRQELSPGKLVIWAACMRRNRHYFGMLFKTLPYQCPMEHVHTIRLIIYHAQNYLDTLHDVVKDDGQHGCGQQIVYLGLPNFVLK